MTFSEFAKMLYPYCGNGVKQSDFVIVITDALLEEPKEDAKDNEHNPVAKYSLSTREKIFSGGSVIGQKQAIAMRQKIYKENFSEYVNALSPDTLDALGKEVAKCGIDANSNDSIGDVCADLFANIIGDIASGDSNNKLAVPVISELNKPFLTEIGEIPHIDLPSSDMSLLIEANGKCPLCRTKPLVTTESGNSLTQYKVVNILPVAPTEADYAIYEELLDSPIDRNSSKNKISLCLECANSYTTLPTKEQCKNLIEIKDKLLRNYLATPIADDMFIEKGIEDVLRGISNASKDDLSEKLEYSAMKIEKKITDVALMIKAGLLAQSYYLHIKGIFSLLEREKDLDFDDVAGNVKATYNRYKKKNLTQEEIFTHLTDWLLGKSQTDNRTACEIVVAFFIQNCEVFDEITE